MIHSRGNPNIDITECFFTGRINPNEVTNTVMQYLHLNLNRDIHMEKTIDDDIADCLFSNGSFRVASGLVFR